MTTPQLADFVADAVLATDGDYRVTYWNDAATRLFGWDRDEAMGRHALELLQVSFEQSSLEQAARTVAETGRWNGLVTHVARDGRTVSCEAVVAGLPDGRGNVVVLHDLAERHSLIDQRQVAENRLAAALAFHTKVLEAAPVGIQTFRLTGECVSCNAAAAEIVGGTVGQLLEQNFRSIASWQQSGLLALAEQAITSRRPQVAQIAMFTTYGRSVWLLVRAAVFRSQDEEMLVLVIGDITDLKRVEEELRETDTVLRTSQAQLRKLSPVVEQSPSSVIITNRDGTIEYVNPSFTALSGYSSSEVIGQNPRMFKSGELPAEVYRLLWSTILAGRTWRGELRNRSKNGDLYWLRAAIFPIVDERGLITNFVSVEEPIGDLKAAEAAAADAEHRFLRAQRMEAIGQLAGGVAHDFNNLLTAILAYSDFVRAAVRDNAAVTADVEEIKKAAERAARLTRQLLAFSRRQRLEPKDVNLNQIVDDLMKMVRRVIGENIQLTVATDDELELSRLDPAQIEQVLMNLVVNARDAMPEGGRLLVSTANVDLDEGFVRAHAGSSAGEYVALRVSDTGTGIPPEIAARVFEPFFTTKPPGQGTGLGLATVFGIVKQSEGYITLDSTPGSGTTFTAYFPRLRSGHVVDTRASSESLPLDGHETILLAEDQADIRRVVQRALEQHGYRVLPASNGIEALSVEQSHAAVIDLLLADMIMPQLGGPDIARRLARRRPHMKVLYMSGLQRQGSGDAPSIAQDAAVIFKPFSPEALVQRVREVLNRPDGKLGAGSPPDPSLA